MGIVLVEKNRVWICSKCKRVYPYNLNYCPKCNISRKFALKFVNAFINKESKIELIKSKNNKIVENRKKLQERYRKKEN